MDDSLSFDPTAAADALRSWSMFIIAGIVPLMIMAARDAIAKLRAHQAEVQR